jgi:hypothetical protein
MSIIVDRMIAHASAPGVYDAPTPDEMRVVARQWQAMEKALKGLKLWFDTDHEILAAMGSDTLADHERQVRLIKEALPK